MSTRERSLSCSNRTVGTFGRVSKTLFLGSAGQLGRDLAPLLPGELVPLTRADPDFATPGSVTAVVKAHAPDAVVNCAAYNFVDKAEAEPDAAFAVNAWAVRELATACHDVGAKFVHVSTDYVFGLDATRSSHLRSLRLARHRRQGRQLRRDHAQSGRAGKAAAGAERPAVHAECHQGRGRNDRRFDGRRRGWAVHAANAGSCTWHEFAAEIFRQADVTADLSPCATADRPVPAKRPHYSVPSMAKLATVGVPALQPLQDALGAYLDERGLGRVHV